MRTHRNQFLRQFVAIARTAALSSPAFAQTNAAGEYKTPVQVAAAESAPVQVAAANTNALAVERVTITARRREEDAQRVPVSASVITAGTLDKTSTVNLSQLTQLAPSLNYTSPNPRNTAYTIRGLGSSVVAIAQANDGLEPGVGFYIDQVYYGRPAAGAFDFFDIDRVEI
jgi:iron complex outermembrane receptor protein